MAPARRSIRDVQEVRAAVGHPIIDADGHTIECWPLLDEYCRAEGIANGVADVRAARRLSLRSRWSSADSRGPTPTRSPWWIFPAKNTHDFAAASVPALLEERLEEIGIDFAVVYPTEGLTFPHVPDSDLRVRACRALNRYHHDVFAPHRHRMIVPAVIPMHDPVEAVEELRFAVTELGFKTVLVPSYVERPMPERGPDDLPYSLDMYGLDSPYDYDSVWRLCVELGVAVSTHSSTQGIGFRASPSNYMYNHIGHFAASGEAVCKALLMGGVVSRFPAIRFAFLEGGVGTATGLLGDLCGHWEKRNPENIRNYDPGALDRGLFEKLFTAYATPAAAAAVQRAGGVGSLSGATLEPVDDWERSGIRSVDDIIGAFQRNFCFGCEADDPMTPVAFGHVGGLPRLNAVFSSDIGHWDVPDMAEVVLEAYEPVERGHLSPADFRSFAFSTIARFYLDSNPTFFAGTTVEAAVASELG